MPLTFSPGALGEPLRFERLVNDQLVIIEIEAPPKRNRARMVLMHRCMLAPFVRINRENEAFLKLVERIAFDLVREQERGSAANVIRLPAGSRLIREVASKMGAIASGKIVERKINGPRSPSPSEEKRWFESFEPVNRAEMLLFYEDDEAAMFSLLKYA